MFPDAGTTFSSSTAPPAEAAAGAAGSFPGVAAARVSDLTAGIRDLLRPAPKSADMMLPFNEVVSMTVNVWGPARPAGSGCLES